MTMKKKILTTLSVVLILGLAALGILAYLQSEDSDVNVMTLGNVQIEQIEQERNAEGDLVDFTQGKPAFPAVGPIAWDDTKLNVNDAEYKVFTDDLKNVIDKIVTVKNTGKSDAYVRTIVAIEAPEFDPQDLIHINYNSTGLEISEPVTATIDGVDYVAFVFTYNEALAPKAISAPSLMQVFLDSKATNEDVAKFGDTWEIKVLSQAVQAEGFDAADVALNEAFGEANAAKVAEWFADKVGADEDDIDFKPAPADAVQVSGNDKAAVIKAISEAEDGGVIALTEDTTIAGYAATNKLTIEKDVTLDLNGKTLTTECGWGGIDLKGGASIVNGTINHTGNTAAIKAFQVEKIENVKINVTETAGKIKGGIVVQNGANDCVGTIKNVTITGATNGIECYRSTNNPAIGSMENVKIDAIDNGIYLNGAGRIGKISNCTIEGGNIGINAYLANLWHISLDIENSIIKGGASGIDVWDEGATNAGSTVTLNYNYATKFEGGTNNIKVTLQEEITCNINGKNQTTPCDLRK